MNRLKRTAAALAATVGMVALPAAAHAGVLVEYSVNGGAFTPLCSDPLLNSCSSIAGGIIIPGLLDITTASIVSNSPGNPTSADIFTTTTLVQSLLPVGGATTHKKIRYGGDGFTMPTNGTLLSNFSGTSTTGGAANTVAFISCAVGAPATVVLHVPCPGGTMTAALTPNITGNSFSASNTASVPGVVAPYVLAEQLDLTLTAGSQINFANSTDLITPEPSSMMLMGTGLFGLVGFVRRRQKNS